jgi:hypothetical protein
MYYIFFAYFNFSIAIYLDGYVMYLLLYVEMIMSNLM